MSVVTRIPPSPTGRLHIGTARTALFNYLFARHHGGKIVFRSEDTDRTRSKKEYEEEIVEGLQWLGLSWNSFSRQSERTERYRELLHQVVDSGHAYVSKEPSKDDPTKEIAVVRLKNPGTEVIFEDLIRGPINTHTGDLGDFVIARSIDDALYHFAVVVDDYDGGVTHVIRGEDHISNTARQILIQEALGFPRPAYAHLPLILAADRSKMSKRHGAVSIVEYQNEGFLPQAIINYLALLGWNPGDNREDFTLEELVQEFDLAKVQKGGAIFDSVKFKSVNQRWMRKLSDDEFMKQLGMEESERLRKIVPLLRERVHTFKEAIDMLSGELSSIFKPPALHEGQLTAKELPERKGLALNGLKRALEAVSSLPEGVSAAAAKEVLMPLADEAETQGKGGRGAVLWPLRYALSGQERSPDPFTLVFILGPKESALRIARAIAILSANA